MSRESRYRNFSFVLYPEDELDNYCWINWIIERHVPCLAIQHEPENDETKRHVHCLVHFDNPTTRTACMEVFKHVHVPRSGSPDFFSSVASVSGLERYFLHLDQPGKIQYGPQDLHLLCGYELHMDDNNGPASPCNVLYRLARDCRDYQTFVVRVADSRPDLLGYVSSHCYFFMSLYN